MNNLLKSDEGIWLLILGVIFFLWLFFSPLYAYTTKNDIEFTVTKSERVNGKESSKYLLFTDKGVWQNSDSVWYLKFDSSDLYGEIQEGQKYKVSYYGWRVELFSWYPNVISIESVD